MSTVTENDLQRLEDLINKQFDLFGMRFDSLEKRFDSLEKRFDSLENEQKDIKNDITEIKINIATLKEGQNGLNKRLDNLDFIARTIIASVAIALLAGLMKILFPNLIS